MANGVWQMAKKYVTVAAALSRAYCISMRG